MIRPKRSFIPITPDPVSEAIDEERRQRDREKRERAEALWKASGGPERMKNAEQRLVDLFSARGLDLPRSARSFFLNCVAGNMPIAELEQLLQQHHPDIYRALPDIYREFHKVPR
jgi:hypothetical protein